MLCLLDALPSIGALPVIYNIAVGMSVRAEMFVHLYRHSIALLLRFVRQLCCRELPAVCDQCILLEPRRAPIWHLQPIGVYHPRLSFAPIRYPPPIGVYICSAYANIL